jgi:hypothetical protein
VSEDLKTDKDVGKLLYHVATKLKTRKYQRQIVDYIATKKITSENQLNGRSVYSFYVKHIL